MNLSGFSPLISAATFILSAAVVVIKLHQVQRDRFVAITSGLFQIWPRPDFMKAQLWLISDLKERFWEGFRSRHGGQDGEAPFLGVSGFCNRVSTLINLRVVDERAILTDDWLDSLRRLEAGRTVVKDARGDGPGALADFELSVPHCKACV